MPKIKKFLPFFSVAMLVALILIAAPAAAQETFEPFYKEAELKVKPINPEFADQVQVMGTGKQEFTVKDSFQIEPQQDTADLVASFASGTWVYSSQPDSWLGTISSSTAHATAFVDITGNGQLDLVASFNSGTWYLTGSGWVRLSTSTAKAMGGIGDLLYASFPSGTWEYYQGNWYRISTSPAHAITFADMVPDGYWNQVFSFNSGTWFWEIVDGEWRWVRLSPSTARALAGFPYNYLIASFDSGTWHYDNGSWVGKLSNSTSHALTYAHMRDDAVNPSLVASFNSGTWYVKWKELPGDQWTWSWARLSISRARAMEGIHSHGY